LKLFFTVLILLAAAYAVWQRQELKKFCVTRHTVQSSKVNSEIKLVVISDLHSFAYGRDNERLVSAVRDENPDLILIPGDIIVSGQEKRFGISLDLLRQTVKIAPVYFCNGNHESRAEEPGTDYYEPYRDFRRQAGELGVEFLNNKSCVARVRGDELHIRGLELPLTCYKKGRRPYLKPGYVEKSLGQADGRHLEILMAHNPAFAKQYARWGADITLSGHNHGGLIRIPGIGSLLSPQFMFFPEYDAGAFDIDGHMVYISRGLGTHTFHIRICNRAELLSITVCPSMK